MVPGKQKPGIDSGLYRLLQHARFFLPPVSLNKEPATAAVYPVTWYPYGMGTRCKHISTGDPDIAGAVPAMITTCPYIPASWRRSRVLHHDRGRSDANGNLRKRWRGGKSASKDSSECNFLHGSIVSSENFRPAIRQDVNFCVDRTQLTLESCREKRLLSGVIHRHLKSPCLVETWGTQI